MKYKKHSFEEKLHCMKLLDQGYPLRKLSREIGIMREQFRALRVRYLAFDEDVLRRKSARYPTEAEMVSVLIYSNFDKIRFLDYLTSINQTK